MDFKSKKFLVLTKIVVDFETCVLTAAVVQSSNSSFIFALFRLFFLFYKMGTIEKCSRDDDD